MWRKFGQAGYDVFKHSNCTEVKLSISFLGITADEDYGGLAMGYQAHCIVMEEISKASGAAPVPIRL